MANEQAEIRREKLENLSKSVKAYPEKYKIVRSYINETDFVTDFNRNVFVVLCEKIEENTSSNILLTLSSLFDSDKIGKIMSYISSLEAIEVNDDKIKQIAQTLKEEKIKANIGDMSINDSDFSSRLEAWAGE